MIKLLQHLSRIKSCPAKLFFWGVLFLFALAHIIIYVAMPYTCDDYWYMTPLRDYFMGIDTSFPVDDLWSCWYEHYTTDNIRLSNIVFTFILLLPKIIPSILSGLLVGVMLWQSAKLAGISWRNPLLFIHLTFGLTFALPWYEQMFSLCYAFNYIWASVLSLMLAYVFFCKKTLPGVVWSFLHGLIVGAWHEGFSVPLLAGFVSYLVYNRNEINRQRVAIISAMVVGLLWLMSAPGFQTNVEHKTVALQLSSIISKLVLYHAPLCILVLSILFVAIKKNTRNQIFDPVFLSFVIICLVGVALNLFTNVGVRTGWMGYLFGMIATIYLWKNMEIAKRIQFKSIVKRISIVVVSLFLLAHYIVVEYYAIMIGREYENVLEKYQESPDGVVFADVTYDYQVSPLAWKKPYFENFTYILIAYWIDNYYNSGKNLRVIPTCLFNAESLDAVKVKGDNPFMIYDGFLYAPIGVDEKIDGKDFYDIDFGFSQKKLMCSNFIFTTKRGNKYYFAFPQRATIHRWFGEIEEMNRAE